MVECWPIEVEAGSIEEAKRLALTEADETSTDWDNVETESTEAIYVDDADGNELWTHDPGGALCAPAM